MKAPRPLLRTLIFMPHTPTHPGTGGHLRTRLVANAAATLGPVSLASLGRPAPHLPGWPGPVAGWREEKRPPVRRYPWSPTKFRLTGPIIGWALELVSTHHPDCVVLEGVDLFDLLQPLRQRDIPVVMNMHNLESERVRKEMPHRPGAERLIGSLVGARAFDTAREVDRVASTEASRCWVCSELEVAKLKALGGGVARFIANPVPDGTAFDHLIEPVRYEQARTLFVGALRYTPNLDAISILMKDIAPRVRLWAPDALFTLAGRDPKPALRQLARETGANMQVNLPELDPLIAGHGYALMPIRIGGGTRLKALEAMAAGLVIVATEKAVEGIGLVDGETFVRAETPEAFDKALRDLVATPERAQAIAMAARAVAAESYTKERLIPKIAAELQLAVS